MKTTVFNVRGRTPNTVLRQPDFVYVGRPCRGWKASPFGNPFRVHEPFRPDITPAEAVGRFARWLATGEHEHPETAKAMDRRRAEILRLLPTLRGKRLGCWCVDWDGTGEPANPCHAVVLARLAEETKGGGP